MSNMRGYCESEVLRRGERELITYCAAKRWPPDTPCHVAFFPEIGGMNEIPRVVCLCGSTKFREEFIVMNQRLTLQGDIVLSVGMFAHSGDVITPEQKKMLDNLHKRKIDLADEILVLNVGGYIGDSTRSEIDYATRHGKKITYLEDV